MQTIPGLNVSSLYASVTKKTMVWFTLAVDDKLNLDEWPKVRNPDTAIERVVAYLDEMNIGLVSERIDNARAWMSLIVQRIEKGNTRFMVSLPYGTKENYPKAMNTIFMVMGWLNVPFRIVNTLER